MFVQKCIKFRRLRIAQEVDNNAESVLHPLVYILEYIYVYEKGQVAASTFNAIVILESPSTAAAGNGLQLN